MQIFLLAALLVCALILPLAHRKTEENLEIFLFFCGAAAVSISKLWSWHLVSEALRDPLQITLAVLVIGLLFKKFYLYIDKTVRRTVSLIGLRWTLFLIVVILGLTSSLITAIIAALILSEVAALLRLTHAERVKLVIYTCFAISVGAVLTPFGEPLGTIVMAKLAGPPHYAGTVFIFRMLWPYIFSITLVLGFMAFALVKEESAAKCEECKLPASIHSAGEILLRAFKVYIFVVALVLLGAGLQPLAYKTIYFLKPWALYWVNIISAVLDNATLAAIEIVPDMPARTLKFLLVSLILGGGMLIPGNIPNIICSSKLKIKSTEWAKTGVPLGFALLLLYFIIMIILVK
ncbi:MAG: DUF1646 domain-containing protein [Elusimicrobia bacterium]|nr:DUF1646 domain-containing protein [Elusimicrobiota bacterium]